MTVSSQGKLGKEWKEMLWFSPVLEVTETTIYLKLSRFLDIEYARLVPFSNDKDETLETNIAPFT